MRLTLILAGIIALIAYGGGLYWLGDHNGVSRTTDRLELKYAQEMAKAQQDARAKEDALTAKYDQIANEYEQGKRDAQAAADKFVADLRDERIKLRNRWTCPKLPSAETSPSEPDATERDREESAGRIVRAAAECDQQVTKLQDIIRADRQ